MKKEEKRKPPGAAGRSVTIQQKMQSALYGR